jgi:ABC-type enterochelin transport system substrate-binding protein
MSVNYYGMEIDSASRTEDHGKTLPTMDLARFNSDYESDRRYEVNTLGQIVDHDKSALKAEKALLDSLQPISEIDEYTDRLKITNHY